MAEHQNKPLDSPTAHTESKTKRARIRLRHEMPPPPSFDKKMRGLRRALNAVLFLTAAMVVAVGFAPIEELYRARGVVRPAKSQYLLAPADMELRDPPEVQEGDAVEADQVLMRFHLPDFERRILDTETDIENHKADLRLQQTKTKRLERLPLPPEFWEMSDQVAAAKLRMVAATAQLERMESLIESGAASTQQVEEAHTAFEQAKIAHERMQGRFELIEDGYGSTLVDEAKAEEARIAQRITGDEGRLAAMRAELERLECLRAPGKGMVLELPHKHTRGMIARGEILAYLSQGDEKQVEIFGFQKNVDQVQVGHPVRYKSEVFDPFKKGYARGEVLRISSIRRHPRDLPDASGQQRYYSIFASITEQPQELTLDSNVTAQIVLRKAPLIKVFFDLE